MTFKIGLEFHDEYGFKSKIYAIEDTINYDGETVTVLHTDTWNPHSKEWDDGYTTTEAIELCFKKGTILKLEGSGMAFSTFRVEIHYKRLGRSKYNYYELLYGLR